jgi:hypothetical protein
MRRALLACVLALGALSFFAPGASAAFRLAWAEDFSAQSANLKTGCPGTKPECLGTHVHAVAGRGADFTSQRARSAVSVSKGSLWVDARPSWPGEGPAELSTGLALENGAGRVYGAWEVSARYGHDPTGQVIFNALTWPVAGRAPGGRVFCWPVDGENNFAESMWGGGGLGHLHYFVHGGNRCNVSYSFRSNDDVRVGGAPVDSSQWHVYRLEHTRQAGQEHLRFLVDGVVTWEFSDARIPHVDAMRLSLQADAWHFAGRALPYVSAQFDYVRVYNVA